MKTLLATALLCCSVTAHSLGRLADVRIVDRDSGAALETHYYRGEYWVAGTPGARYAIEIHSRLGERLLAVTAVDGVNVVSGETAAWNQSGYVFDPWAEYDITGWRKSDAEVAAFSFTALPISYAARTGRPANVGVIGVALFRERRVQPPPAAATAPSAPSADAALMTPRGAPKLGTAHGEREYAWVGHSAFARLQPEPNEVIRIRYDSLDNLIAMGIVPGRNAVAKQPNPFPGSGDPRYVPDPPG